jgi:hypothetical protein
MNHIPELVPNTNIAGKDSNESIRITATNLSDIKINESYNCSVYSMAPDNIESIKNLKL